MANERVIVEFNTAKLKTQYWARKVRCCSVVIIVFGALTLLSSRVNLGEGYENVIGHDWDDNYDNRDDRDD
jgi:hypothetical protein